MAQKGKNSTFELRQLVIYHTARGVSVQKIAEMLNMRRSMVSDKIKIFKCEDRIESCRIESCKQSGRPQKLTKRDETVIVRAVKKNPKVSAPKLITMLSTDHGKTVHPRTVNHVIQRSGLKSRVAQKKPYISKVNRKKRLAFATKWLDASETWWNSVIFTDESKYNIFGSDGYQRVWRSPNTEFEE